MLIISDDEMSTLWKPFLINEKNNNTAIKLKPYTFYQKNKTNSSRT